MHLETTGTQVRSLEIALLRAWSSAFEQERFRFGELSRALCEF
jgi:hypothetical protein